MTCCIHEVKLRRGAKESQSGCAPFLHEFAVFYAIVSHVHQSQIAKLNPEKSGKPDIQALQRKYQPSQ